MELWDGYDRDLHRLPGVTLVRGEAIPEGVYHLVCDVLVRHTDGTYLLMQRDPDKETHPLEWEASAGGSALQGEDPDACAQRELLEETGIATGQMEFLGQIVVDHQRTIYCEFLSVTDCAKDVITLQEGETIAYRWVSAEEIRAMKQGELATHRVLRFVPELQPV